MSEIEQLESLSNAALREKCLQFGLPNVPVTDSSRRVLIKKLAAILGDPSGGKKVNRRETIHSTKPMTPTKSMASGSSASVIEERSTPSRSSRRTIAVPASVEEKEEKKLEEKAIPPPISERRRSASQRTFTETEEAVSKPAPITERRRSTRGESQPKMVQTKISANKPQKTIAEEEEEEVPQQPPRSGKRSSVVRDTAPFSSSRKPSASLEIGSVVILDSEDEEDEDLVVAAERVEKQIKSQIPTAIRGNSRPPSLSNTNVYTTHTSSAPAASVGPIVEETPSYKPAYSVGGVGYGTSQVGSGSLYTTASQRSSYSAFSSSQPSRTSTEYVSSLYNTKDRFSLAPSLGSSSLTPSLGSSSLTPSLGSSSLYKPTATTYTSTLQNRPLAKVRVSSFTNEQSDDNDIALDEKDTPYLSQFARNLERLKAEHLQSSSATLSSRYSSSLSYNRQRKFSENGIFKQFWFDLNRKYHITFYTKIIVAFMLVIFVYIMFFY